MSLLSNYPILNMEDEKKIIYNTKYNKKWKQRYYSNTIYSNNQEDIDNICKNYLEGLVWTFRYYMIDCDSWQWKYNYNHGPLLSDLYNYVSKYDNVNKIKFPKTKPVPFQVQLLSILPKESSKLLPIEYRNVFRDSQISYLYPNNYKLNSLFKRYYWQCEPILPYLNLKEVIQVYKKINRSKKQTDSIIIHKTILVN